MTKGNGTIDFVERVLEAKWRHEAAAALFRAEHDPAYQESARQAREVAEAQARRLRGKTPEQIICGSLNQVCTLFADIGIGLERINTPEALQAKRYFETVLGYCLTITAPIVAPVPPDE